MAKTVGKYDENEAVYCRDTPLTPLYTQNIAAGTKMNESWAQNNDTKDQSGFPYITLSASNPFLCVSEQFKGNLFQPALEAENWRCRRATEDGMNGF